MNKTGGQRAVFLDRDGTINVEVNYLSRPGDVRLIPGADRAIAAFNRAGLAVVVVSNQSGLARGYFTDTDLEAVRAEVDRQLAAGGARVDAYYHCPHYPGGKVPELSIECGCRKPAPGMVLRAAREMGLSLEGSFMVGDKNADVACGRAAGLAAVRVLSGHDQPVPACDDETPDFVASNLEAAAQWILVQLEDNAA